MKLTIKAKIQISKPAKQVFDAIIDPEKMSNYFIERGSGKMETGESVIWNFPEFPDDCPIKVKEIKPDNFISFSWDNGNVETLVSIKLDEVRGGTVVTVVEDGMENDEKGIQWLKGNTEGWANFLACLKGYLEYGINLRKGAFDFMKQ
ncbi:Activator of Hsp90 ATPase 1 family protein [Pseudopedobacter saltans DSM 12145]|uniref:Activator of Hsp90 ATPase 1 family protein n=1 Tax=Pseudopedobacter saltans (strain ATCC 51119 / DSM 12145 / JCM 21818 / CCUG 39354 / LMG 10337 / NBRC 100064 / NCIMB 13643) TaxID=762903 RepID=F0S9Q7_PSESL|nr:SRPBCC domain-containing protein [Pseudopedobacter saltans]ADY51413.1 Activator of Hsp90 ATPase 1 family protein [Pseudopedobacter saltans DSM 12145]